MTDGRMADSVLITGAGTGFGLATALRLARRGLDVYATVPDMSQEGAVSAAAAEAGVHVHVLRLDVTDAKSVQAAVAAVVARSGGIHTVVNNAGLGLRGFFEDLADDEIRRLFDVNVFGAIAVTAAALPHLRAARRGRVVFVSSAGGRIGALSLSGYCASKFAVEGLAESLAMEVAPLGISVSLVEPGLVMTPHFTVNRGRARAAVDPASPYYDWFVRHETLVDEILRARRISADDVGAAIERAVTDRRPRLRYVVGRGARLMIALQRYLPAELFARLYSAQVLGEVRRPRPPAGSGGERTEPPRGGLVRAEQRGSEAK
jgi:NAD(P)-dependent dehydrogenase (short-subunit alcohol dehydrogenase family)